MFENQELIEKEDWKKAEGVKFTGTETNSALTDRDYSIKCKTKHKIVVVKGYWVWWCSTHHQPELKCEIGRLKQNISNNVLVMLNVNR